MEKHNTNQTTHTSTNKQQSKFVKKTIEVPKKTGFVNKLYEKSIELFMPKKKIEPQLSIQELQSIKTEFFEKEKKQIFLKTNIEKQIKQLEKEKIVFQHEFMKKLEIDSNIDDQKLILGKINNEIIKIEKEFELKTKINYQLFKEKELKKIEDKLLEPIKAYFLKVNNKTKPVSKEEKELLFNNITKLYIETKKDIYADYFYLFFNIDGNPKENYKKIDLMLEDDNLIDLIEHGLFETNKILLNLPPEEYHNMLFQDSNNPFVNRNKLKKILYQHYLFKTKSKDFGSIKEYNENDGKFEEILKKELKLYKITSNPFYNLLNHKKK
jgi:hypothetical protein